MYSYDVKPLCKVLRHVRFPSTRSMQKISKT
jgi:hypothetical protein